MATVAIKMSKVICDVCGAQVNKEWCEILYRNGEVVCEKYANQKILDPCCGSRMMYFDKSDQRVLFGDQREERHILKDRHLERVLEVKPDVKLDFTNLPFLDGSFRLVVFDPPHLVRAGKKSWLAKKYGRLGEKWQDDVRKGFSECFRVLEDGGILIFKWNETQIKVKDILALTEEKPLFGHPTVRHKSKSHAMHWFTFMKLNGD